LTSAPDLSLVMPCHDEREVVGATVGELLDAFERAGVTLELVTVDNGSSDGTGELLEALAEGEPRIVVHRIARNQGYGFGILDALPRCRGRWVGHIAADGQVDADDVVRLYELADRTDGRVVAKVRRRFRLDGARRSVVSVVYNLLMSVFWPGIGTLDVNGIPKLVRREVLELMRLESRDWMLDPELMIKARAMGLRVVELNILARARFAGRSHVVVADVFAFLARLASFRFGGALSPWRRQWVKGPGLLGFDLSDR